jgi:hypothetical protein
MFVWVLLEGLLQAVQAMEAAGLQLLQAQADAEAAAGSGSNGPAVIAAEGQPAVQQCNKQQEQAHEPKAASKHSIQALKELAKAIAMLPLLSNLAALLAMPVIAALHAVLGCCGAASSSAQAHKQAEKLKRQQQRQLPRPRHQQRPPWLSLLPVRAAAAAAATPAAGLLWLTHHRAAAAAFKFWLSLNLLMVLVLLLSAGAGGGVHPVVVAGMRAVPTHGVIAFVLAWHERVESTTIRVSGAVR